MPETPQTNILEAQVASRIVKQARAAEERASTLRELIDSLF